MYRSEIDRIWRAQYKALSNKVPPELTDDEEGGDKTGAKREGSVVDGRESSPMFTDRGGSVAPDSNQRRKKLNIRRLVRLRLHFIRISGGLTNAFQVDGQWQVETIRDPNVIAAYIKKKKEEELENMDLDQIKPTGDPVKDAVIKARYVNRANRMG